MKPKLFISLIIVVLTIGAIFLGIALTLSQRGVVRGEGNPKPIEPPPDWFEAAFQKICKDYIESGGTMPPTFTKDNCVALLAAIFWNENGRWPWEQPPPNWRWPRNPQTNAEGPFQWLPADAARWERECRFCDENGNGRIDPEVMEQGCLTACRMFANIIRHCRRPTIEEKVRAATWLYNRDGDYVDRVWRDYLKMLKRRLEEQKRMEEEGSPRP